MEPGKTEPIKKVEKSLFLVKKENDYNCIYFGATKVLTIERYLKDDYVIANAIASMLNNNSKYKFDIVV